jgi:hypothetical protein
MLGFIHDMSVCVVRCIVQMSLSTGSEKPELRFQVRSQAQVVPIYSSNNPCGFYGCSFEVRVDCKKAQLNV